MTIYFKDSKAADKALTKMNKKIKLKKSSDTTIDIPLEYRDILTIGIFENIIE